MLVVRLVTVSGAGLAVHWIRPRTVLSESMVTPVLRRAPGSLAKLVSAELGQAELAAIHVHPVTCSLGVPTRHLDLQFVAHAPPGAQIAISDESDDLQWWPADALPAGTDHALAYLVARARSHTSDE